jgi:hypothetical protein
MIVYDNGDRLQHKDSTDTEQTVATQDDLKGVSGGDGVSVTGSVSDGFTVAADLSTDTNNAVSLGNDTGLYTPTMDSQAGFGQFRLTTPTVVNTTWTTLPLTLSSGRNVSLSNDTVTLGSGIWFVSLTVSANSDNGYAGMLYTSIVGGYSNYNASYTPGSYRVGATTTTLLRSTGSATVGAQSQFGIVSGSGTCTANTLSLWCIRVGSYS